MKTILHSNLWRRWVAANALGEFLGLGLTIGVFALVFTRLGEARGIGMTLAVFALEVSAGAIEATIVGLAQWWAMHPWFPGISRRAWWLSTLAGALFAYILGFLPSTLMSLGEQAAPEAAPMTEPPQWIVMLLAAAMGLAAGAVLSFAQWLVLRKKARGAGCGFRPICWRGQPACRSSFGVSMPPKKGWRPRWRRCFWEGRCCSRAPL